MPAPIKFQSTDWTFYHATQRCRKGYAFLKPIAEVTSLFLGVLEYSREAHRDTILVHNLVVMSNHYHLLVSAKTPEDLGDFMQLLNGNVAREINRVWDEEGSMWGGRRYRSHSVLDEGAIEDAYTYVFANTFKERLVEHPRDWPGFHGFQVLGEGKEVEGVWYRRTEFDRKRRLKSGKDLTLDQFKTVYKVGFDRPLIWDDLEGDVFKKKMHMLMDRVFEEWGAGEDESFLGAEGVLGQEVYKRRRPKAGKQPLCRARCVEIWRQFRDAYRVFKVEYQEANRALGEALRWGRSIESIQFPTGGILPGAYRHLKGSVCNDGVYAHGVPT